VGGVEGQGYLAFYLHQNRTENAKGAKERKRRKKDSQRQSNAAEHVRIIIPVYDRLQFFACFAYFALLR
jgi:hypothetical protein